MINLFLHLPAHRVIYYGLVLNCVGRFQSVRANTCSRAAKDCCRPWRPAAPAGSPTAPCAGGPLCSGGESPSDDTLETIGRPGVGRRFVRLDSQDLTADSAPVCAKIEAATHDGRKSFSADTPCQGALRDARPVFCRDADIEAARQTTKTLS